VAYIL